MGVPLPRSMYRCVKCTYWWNRDERGPGRCACGGELELVNMENHMGRLKDALCVPPWNETQVKSLNDYQASGRMHPFTANDGSNLIATTNGWVTKDKPTVVVQKWCHGWMADGRWNDEIYKKSKEAK